MRRGASLLAVALVITPACREIDPAFGGPGSEDGGSTSTEGASSSSSGSPSTSTTTAPSTTGDPTTTGEASTTTSDPSTTSDVSTSTTAGSGSTGSCPAGEMDCFGVCVDLMTDADNCGECGNRCNPAQEACVRGMCMPD